MPWVAGLNLGCFKVSEIAKKTLTASPSRLRSLRADFAR